jgi:anti-sigma factor RsiW
MRCKEARSLIPEYVDGGLMNGRREALASHLEGCPECRQEREAEARALAALVGAATPVPDLWEGFTARLADALTCAEAEEWSSAHYDGRLDTGSATALRRHLRECEACGAARSVMSGALGALDRAAAAGPEVDLWPALARRLEREPRIAGWRGWLPALAPVRAPVLALAACALVAAVVSLRTLPGRRTAQPGPVLARALQPAPAQNPQAPGRRVTPAPEPERMASRGPGQKPGERRAAAHVAHRHGRWGTDRRVLVARLARRPVARRTDPVVKMASGGAPERHPVEAVRSEERKSGFWPGQLQVAYNVPAAPDGTPGGGESVAPGDQNPATTRADVMPEVTQAVSLLADFNDSVQNPFSSTPDVQ